LAVKAAILAGGKGLRFRPFTDLIPKPMIPVGVEEKPILEYIVSWLARHGIRNIVLLVGYRWRQIANYFRDGSAWGVHIDYSVDSEKYRGTGGALLQARHRGLLVEDNILVWYGDILAPVDVPALLKYHNAQGSDVTLVLAERYQVPVGVAEVDNEANVVRFTEKPWLDLKVAIGILVLKTAVLDHVEKMLGTSFDIMGDMVPLLIREGYKVKAWFHRGEWVDVGSLERYSKLDHEIIERMLHGTAASRDVGVNNSTRR